MAEGIACLQSWGFRYVTIAFTWVKRTKTDSGWHVGTGYYTRANPEFVLLGKRGGGLKRFDKGVHHLVVYPVGRHSEKPPLHGDIERLFGSDTTRIELFARREVEGWKCIGNEVTGRDIFEDIKILALDL